ncbi:hypothetical protein C3B79_2258 [Aeromonas hydrophila]|nr:hypothetical protein C3B79_2258 [Aeromonas hydrophila]
MKIASLFVMKHHLELIAVQFHQHISAICSSTPDQANS